MKSISVYGSCVSRDPFDSEPLLGQLSVRSYLSKTGIVSQASPSLPGDYDVPMGTDFLSRMVRFDFEKSAHEFLSSSKADSLLIDFIDERLPLTKIKDSYFTRSRHFVQCGLHDQLKGQYIDPADPKHLDLWLKSFDKVANVIELSGYADTDIILHVAWWSRQVRDESGVVTLVDSAALAECHRQNTFLQAAYSAVKRRFPRCRTIEVRRDLIVADATHKWGPDPFHYIPEYNAEFGRLLIECFSSPRARKYDLQSPGVANPASRMIEGVSLYAGSGITRDPIVKEYDLLLPYLSHQREWVAKFKDTGIQFDENGVPQNLFRWGGPYYYSVTIGHHGLSSLARYITSPEENELAAIVSTANWLIANQRDDGAWPVLYDHDWFPQRCDPISAPWVSAMGQGLCISFLCRAAAAIDAGKPIPMSSAELVEAARRAAAPFSVPSSAGGVNAMLFDTYTFYEEYPTRPSSFVLNGFIYSLLGLKDLAEYDGSALALRLYGDGISTLQFALPLYDLGRSTAYDLTHVTGQVFAPNIARPSYHFIHVQLLSALELLHPGMFSVVLERWHWYLKGWGARTN